jgi:hypothetical protein
MSPDHLPVYRELLGADHPENGLAVHETEHPGFQNMQLNLLVPSTRLSNKFVAENCNREILATLLRVHAGRTRGLSDSCPRERRKA